MKYCPTCQTEFEEEIIRFCTKDGTPLIEDTKPTFTDNMPSQKSQNDDFDDGAETIIRRKHPVNPPVSVQPDDDDFANTRKDDGKRIVISTSDKQREQSIRARTNAAANMPPLEKKSSTALTVVMTIFGTLAILALGASVWWFMSNSGGDDANANLNVNENINADLNVNEDMDLGNIDFNENLNTNANVNSNINTNSDLNLNTNTKTPTPTPTKTPTPTRTPTPTPSPTPTTQTPTPTTPSPTPTTQTPTPPKTPTPLPTTPPNQTPADKPPPVDVGMMNGRAVRLPTPSYTSEARQAKASGRVTVTVAVDEKGNVISANATNGHPLLRRSAENAALRSKFKPVTQSGKNVRAVGTVVYNFVN